MHIPYAARSDALRRTRHAPAPEGTAASHASNSAKLSSARQARAEPSCAPGASSPPSATSAPRSTTTTAALYAARARRAPLSSPRPRSSSRHLPPRPRRGVICQPHDGMRGFPSARARSHDRSSACMLPTRKLQRTSVMRAAIVSVASLEAINAVGANYARCPIADHIASLRGYRHIHSTDEYRTHPPRS